MTDPEPVDIGETPSQEPEFVLDNETQQVTVTWPGGRPDSVMMQTDLMEAWVQERNDMVSRIAEQASLIRRMREVLTIVRLGRRPNQRDWNSVNLLTLPRKAQVDLLRRSRHNPH